MGALVERFVGGVSCFIASTLGYTLASDELPLIALPAFALVGLGADYIWRHKVGGVKHVRVD